MLAPGVSRTRWVAATITLTGLGSLLLVALMGVGPALGYGLGMGEWGQVAAEVPGS